MMCQINIYQYTVYTVQYIYIQQLDLSIRCGGIFVNGKKRIRKLFSPPLGGILCTFMELLVQYYVGVVGIFVKGKKKGLHGFVYTYSTHMYTHILAHTKIYNENEVSLEQINKLHNSYNLKKQLYKPLLSVDTYIRSSNELHTTRYLDVQ